MAKRQSIIERLGGESFEFILAKKSYVVNPETDFVIDDTDLSAQFAEQPALYTYIGVLMVKADAVAKEFKLLVEEAEAKAYDRIRTALEAEGTKVTEALLNKSVTLDPEVRRLKRETLMAQTDYALLKEFSEAAKMRADMLVRIGAMQRAEMQQLDMSVSTPRKSNDLVKDAREAIRTVRNSRG